MENGKRKTEDASSGNFRARPISVCSPSSRVRHLFFIFLCFSLASCASLEKPKPEPFYSDAAPPPQKEFRWSNGNRLPKSFDPSLASAAPETDVARALFEGLTDSDARTLKTVPAIAVDWTTSDDNRTWIFKLRRDAEWSNGERVTANDFVRSWKRLAAQAERVPHFNLLTNIAGVEQAKKENIAAENPTGLNLFSQKDLNENLPPIFKQNSEEAAPPTDSQTSGQTTKSESQPAGATDDSAETANGDAPAENKKDASKTKPPAKDENAFGAIAVDDFTLKVSLRKPDKDFPALVAHPVFRPVFGDGKALEAAKSNGDIVTSGAFRVANVSQTDGVTLERSESFWNKKEVKLERVRFVPAANAERALEAYRAGEIDAVTNQDFEPLALKLLTPFDDFRRAAHGALNFYEFNRAHAPFDDRRVREALTIAVERERLTQDELDGASVPALKFLPFADDKNLNFSQNVERARNLLAAAGFANGEDFPVVRLVVNRNNVQQKVARAVAKMWKQNLNVDAEIVVVESAEIEAARASGDFDVLRRGALFQTTSEAMNMLAIFGGENKPQKTPPTAEAASKIAEKNKKSADAASQDGVEPDVDENIAGEQSTNQTDENNVGASETLSGEAAGDEKSRVIATEADAVGEFAAIPLYFPTSFSLVKPYVRGFDVNTLDAPSLKNVSIDNEWRSDK